MQIYWNRRNCLHKKRVQLPQDWLGTLTWPPFHWFGTSIWPPWRHVKTLYKVFRSEDCDLDAGTTRPSRPTAALRCSMCVKDLFQFCAVAVQAILNSFSCRHEKLSVRIFASWPYSWFFRRLLLLWKRIAWPGNNARVHLFSFTRRGKSTIFTAESRHLGDKQKSSNHFLKRSAVVMRLWRYSSSLKVVCHNLMKCNLSIVSS